MGTNKTNSSLSEAEERISELEERMVETLKQGRIQQKRIKRNRYNLRDLWDNIKCANTRIIDSSFFSSAYRIFSRIGYLLGYKTSAGKFKKTEIIRNIFSNHNSMRLEINYKKKLQKNINTWCLKEAIKQ